MKLITGSLLAAASLLVAGPASADLAVFGAYDGTTYDLDVQRATVECSSCEGLLTTIADGATITVGVDPGADDANGFSTTDANTFVLANSNPVGETAFVNTVTGESFATGTQIDGGGGDLTITTDAEYILIKIGTEPNYVLIHNTDGLQEFDWTALAGQGAGLSHYLLFGATTTVPEPGILALLGVGLALVGFTRRRKIA